MSSIGGPGGIGGPKGPGGPTGPDAPDATDDLDQADHAADAATNAGGSTGVHGDPGVGGTAAAAGPARTGDVDAIAAELAAGRLTAHEAIERMVDHIASADDLGTADRAELRELVADLVAHDPYLAALAGRV